jgi:hypothetical protein
MVATVTEAPSLESLPSEHPIPSYDMILVGAREAEGTEEGDIYG